MPVICPVRVASSLLNTTASTPQMPHTPCTLMAPTGSSISSTSRATMDTTTMTPATMPTTIAHGADGASGSAVMDTSPARAPLSAIVRSALPNQTRASTSAATSPPQAARLVLTNTRATAFASSMLESLSSEPPLKPNQPNHSTNMPRVASGMLQPGMALMPPSGSYLPARGPTIRTPASAAAPPQRCTTPEPAKSE